MNRSHYRNRQKGFTLLETMIAMVVLVFGILSISSIFTNGMRTSNDSQIEFIAQQKAQEALESIFTARDTHILHLGANLQRQPGWRVSRWTAAHVRAGRGWHRGHRG